MKCTAKIFACCSIALFLVTACSPAWRSEQQTQPAPEHEGYTAKNSFENTVIQNLASLKGRAAGSKYEKKAASILAREFATLDLNPLREGNNFYFQPFSIPARSAFYENSRLKFKGTGPATNQSQNIVGILPGKSDQFLIFGAHYDGQGINNGQIYPSANDNLSGIAALLDICRALNARKNRNLNYVFVAFGAEEMGLYGSEYFVKNLPFPKEKITGMINLDTIGTASGKMVIEAVKNSPLVQTVYDKLLQYDFQVTLDITDKRTSDHYPFGQAGIDSLSVMAWDWLANNHTPQDTLDKIDYKQLKLVSRAISDAAMWLDENLKQ
ncbi:M28 family metallopeptidase [Zhaonella formicivorans]|uniref:M28 family metallopeptidase n=1 Tax=Zhaonella formicivorans TaxID=2528593 RepID=UPI0010DF3214|nr:DUF4910 domain-containing protein [Zhaonella formicivorans]